MIDAACMPDTVPPGRSRSAVPYRISRYTRQVPLPDGRTALLNTVSGAIDVVGAAVAERLRLPQRLSPSERKLLTDRGHLWRSAHDEAGVMQRVGAHLREEARRAHSLKLVLIPSYRCNLNCAYCWQQPYIKALRRHAFDEPKLADLLRALDALHGRLGEMTSGTELQLFGGEPLLKRHAPVVEAALRHAEARGWRTTVTSNGMGVVDYLPLFRKLAPDELQVTVDGGPELQRVRRRGSDFERIAAGIDRLLFEGETYVKLRVNLDLESLADLAPLANILIDRKWFTNACFMAYVAPTRDGSQDTRRLHDQRVELLRRFLELRDAHPQIEIFQVRGWPGYSEFRALSETGRLPQPWFYACDANLNMLVLDAQGAIYACNEANGEAQHRVGEFTPALKLDEARLREWREPVGMTRSQCGRCALQPYCGGGCALAATDSVYFQGYCQAVRDSFDHGLRQYVEHGELL